MRGLTALAVAVALAAGPAAATPSALIGSGLAAYDVPCPSRWDGAAPEPLTIALANPGGGAWYAALETGVAEDGCGDDFCILLSDDAGGFRTRSCRLGGAITLRPLADGRYRVAYALGDGGVVPPHALAADVSIAGR